MPVSAYTQLLTTVDNLNSLRGSQRQILSEKNQNGNLIKILWIPYLRCNVLSTLERLKSIKTCLVCVRAKRESRQVRLQYLTFGGTSENAEGRVRAPGS